MSNPNHFLLPYPAFERYAAKRAHYARIEVVFIIFVAFSFLCMVACLPLFLMGQHQLLAFSFSGGACALGAAFVVRQFMHGRPEMEISVDEFHSMRPIVDVKVMNEVENSVVFIRR